MIISDLQTEYKVLADKGEVPSYGYDMVNVSYGLLIDDDGLLVKVEPLIHDDQKGKKPRNEIAVPHRFTRSSGIVPNFLCDTIAYMLGFDSKGKPERAAKCFYECGELHRRVLEGVDTPAAKAVLAFFAHDPQWEKAQQYIQGISTKAWELAQTANFDLRYSAGSSFEPVGNDPAVKQAWNEYFNQEDEDASSDTTSSFLSGKQIIPVKTHPKIKGVMGAQSAGASLISFNSPAFCSRNLEQCENAPLSKREAYEYTTALNTLLAKRDYVQHMGDDTIVAWAKSGKSTYSRFTKNVFFPTEQKDNAGEEINDDGVFLKGSVLKEAMKALAHGKLYRYEDIQLRPEEEFHILSLSPNAARISVRFYLTNSFGEFVKNIERHYRDVEIKRPVYDKTELLSTRRLLRQTVNPKSKNAKVPSEMVGAIMKAILSGTPYPVTLINAVERRISAEHDVSADKAAIIKAYFLRKTTNPAFKEVLQVNINEDSNYIPYLLGRLFSIYEQIQRAAIPGITTTIKDKYFSSASATPARIFPILGDLAAKHMRKTWTSEGHKIKLSKALGELSGKVGDCYPTRLTLEERGAFQLGYYFENQKQFTKNNKNESTTDGQE